MISKLLRWKSLSQPKCTILWNTVVCVRKKCYLPKNWSIFISRSEYLHVFWVEILLTECNLAIFSNIHGVYFIRMNSVVRIFDIIFYIFKIIQFDIPIYFEDCIYWWQNSEHVTDIYRLSPTSMSVQHKKLTILDKTKNWIFGNSLLAEIHEFCRKWIF